MPALLLAQKASIVKDLNTPKSGQGHITIYQDEQIEGLIGARFTGSLAVNEGNESRPNNVVISDLDTGAKALHYKEARGYKIQVFSGNEQRQSKSEAYGRKGQIQTVYPDLDVVVTFKSPVWRVRVGNYRTYEEAFEAMKELKDAFPTFGKEMQVMDAVIKIPIYN